MNEMNEKAYKYVQQSREREQKRMELAKAEYEQSAAGRHEKLLKEIAVDTKSLDELHRIADTAERHAQLAEQEAAAAKKESHISTAISVISILIALASLAFSALTFFLR